ncbi:MAG: PepSY-associated TM helix domain-containing protein, partial [Pseudomonadales bacterium]
MRKSLVVLHRWFGLFIAVFLFISGLTGAIISWDHELDEALNPELYKSEWQG